MKLTISSIEIKEGEGFGQHDIFRRKEFGENLRNLIINSEGKSVIALDSKWGEGKSTFIGMWRDHIKYSSPEMKSIYFDAFQNDYHVDPFLALTAELYSLIPSSEGDAQRSFMESASKVGKSLARGGMKLAIRNLSAGLLDGSEADAIKDDISDLLTDEVDSIIEDKIKNYSSDRNEIQNFRGELKLFAKNYGNGSPIVFIVDELDRCKPSFALEILEKIKHLFSVEGIVFLLVTNREQLEETVTAYYGAKDPTDYLHKFVNFWIALPKSEDDHSHVGSTYLRYCLNQMEEDGVTEKNVVTFDTLDQIVRLHRPSLRIIERVLGYVAVCRGMCGREQMSPRYQRLVAFLSFVKAVSPDDLSSPMSFQKLGEYCPSQGGDDTQFYYELDQIRRCIRYELASVQNKRKMLDDKEIQLSPLEETAEPVKRILSWLSVMS